MIMGFLTTNGVALKELDERQLNNPKSCCVHTRTEEHGADFALDVLLERCENLPMNLFPPPVICTSFSLPVRVLQKKKKSFKNTKNVALFLFIQWLVFFI